MNPISAFFVEYLPAVFFFYGLAFFTMGLALLLTGRQDSKLPFSLAIRPLGVFGLLHAAHEWIEMFQIVSLRATGRTPGVGEELLRVLVLVASFLALLAFSAILLSSRHGWRRYWLPLTLLALWAAAVAVLAVVRRPPPADLIAAADVLARYLLGIPGALLGALALMRQQHSFRALGMPQFGRDLVWGASALLLYGAVGQIFVRATFLWPSNVLNGTLFLAWFGIPVQLFRSLMAGVLTLYMVRALRAFELENERRLEEANQRRLAAQEQALEAERRRVEETAQLNEHLRAAARELVLLLDLSNLLASPLELSERLKGALEKVVHSLAFADAGLIQLTNRESGELAEAARTGFVNVGAPEDGSSRYSQALSLGRQCVASGLGLCRHADGAVIEFPHVLAMLKQQCGEYPSPTLLIALPLHAGQEVTGALVTVRAKAQERPLTTEELNLLTAIAQQLELSIENARLNAQAQVREKRLAELLFQVVGAQEAERRRIARELHDATGQSLTAIALGLRGLESLTAAGSTVSVEQIGELQGFGAAALGELRRIIADLRPPQLDDLGLVAALRWYVQALAKRHRLAAGFAVRGEPLRLSSEAETVLFRIAQEALTNVVKHAEATEATVTLTFSSAEVGVVIEDNGQGFDPVSLSQAAAGRANWGLLGIRERALLLGGRCAIESAPGRGTRVVVSVPLVEFSAAAAVEPAAALAVS